MQTENSVAAYDIPGSGKAIDCYPVKELTVDTGRACATGVFAAASEDRGGDRINIAGIQTASHKKNPIVYWLHAFDWNSPDANKPIGITEDPSGAYTVTLDAKNGIAIATTYFTQNTILGEQICALVMDKTIRAQSIGYRELKVERRFEDERYVGSDLTEIEMIETSWVPIPMNQDAVRSVLSRDLCGKSLHASIKAALSPYVGSAPIWANGFSLGAKDMSQAATLPAPAAPPIPPAPPAKTKADDPPEDDGDGAVEKHGSKALRSSHKGLCSCLAKCMKAMEPLDDGDTKSLIETAATSVKDLIDAHEDHHAKKYKDEEPLQNDGGAEGEETGAKDDDDQGDDGDEEKSIREDLRLLNLQLDHKLRLKNQKG